MVQKGWGVPGNANKAHYFAGNEGPAIRSLCMKWFYTGPKEDNNHESVDNCKECYKKAVKAGHIINPATEQPKKEK